MNLLSMTRHAVAAVFRLGPPMVRSATYYRPASFSGATGQTAPAEQTAPVSALVASYGARELGTVVIQPGDEKILVRASELTGISSPAAGDYLVETATGQRRDVLSTRLDPTGLLWTLQTVRSVNEDWGDLTAAAVSADWGDLTATTESEDWMGLN